MGEVIVAVFETAERTEAAMRALEAAGVPAETIRRYGRESETAGQTYGEGMGIGNFWRWLLGEETGHDMNERIPERSIMDRAVDAGGTVLAVPIEEAHATRLMAVLEDQHPLSLREEAAETSAPSAPAHPRVRRYRVG